MAVFLSGQEAKVQRLSLGLSQARVAAWLGLNRTYLSLFESERYVLSDAQQRALQKILVGGEEAPPFSGEDHGASGPGDEDSGEDYRALGPHRPMDGFLVPAGLPEREAEAILAEYRDNVEWVRALFEEPLPRGWFGLGTDWEAVEDRRDELLRLMSRNFLLIEALHGHQTTSAEEEAVGPTLGSYTLAYVRRPE